MARITLLILTVMFIALTVVDGRYYGRRVRRGFNNKGSGKIGGYGRSSDERDASFSHENNTSGGCNSGHDKSGSRELAFNRDGRQSGEQTRGGRSFSRSSASATASASSFSDSQHRKKNAVR